MPTDLSERETSLLKAIGADGMYGADLPEGDESVLQSLYERGLVNGEECNHDDLFFLTPDGISVLSEPPLRTG